MYSVQKDYRNYSNSFPSLLNNCKDFKLEKLQKVDYIHIESFLYFLKQK